MPLPVVYSTVTFFCDGQFNYHHVLNINLTKFYLPYYFLHLLAYSYSSNKSTKQGHVSDIATQNRKVQNEINTEPFQIYKKIINTSQIQKKSALINNANKRE